MIFVLLSLPAIATTSVEETFGDVSETSEGWRSAKLNTFDVHDDVVLEEIAQYLEPTEASADLTYVVYRLTGDSWWTGQEWRLEYESDPVVLGPGADFRVSPFVGFLLDGGQTYAIGVHIGQPRVNIFWEGSPGQSDVGWATRDGHLTVNNATATNPQSSIDGDSNGGRAYHQRITVGIPDDLDGDGFNEFIDCNDIDPLVFPGAPERCNGLDDDCDTLADESVVDLEWYPDGDGDGDGDAEATATIDCDRPVGMSITNTDCDDTNPNTYLGAPEICDGLDNNCNDVPEDGVVYTDWYADVDGDGFGDGTQLPTTTCDGAPSGSVDNGLDCNDAEASANPEGVEICDGLDNNCNGATDEGYQPRNWYPDEDGDGQGVDSGLIVTCESSLPGFVNSGGDCDDTRPSVYSGAAELCDDLDNDCDGDRDEDFVFEDYFLDNDGDGFGDPLKSLDTCDGPPEGYVSAGTDCDDDHATVYPGADEICDGWDNDCSGSAGPLELDLDNDGYLACDDCADDDETIFPGAEETCDGVDRDCDGVALLPAACEENVSVEDYGVSGCNTLPGSSWLWPLALLPALRRRRSGYA